MKRKRAEKKGSETETESNQAPIEKQQPDVTKLSENLPSGWQVRFCNADYSCFEDPSK